MVKSWNDSLGYSTTGAVVPEVPAGAIRGGGGGGGIAPLDLAGGAGGVRGGGSGEGAVVVISATAPEALVRLPTTDCPQSEQNFASGNNCRPHPVQVIGNRKPQLEQNFEKSAVEHSHLGQTIGVSNPSSLHAHRHLLNRRGDLMAQFRRIEHGHFSAMTKNLSDQFTGIRVRHL